MSARAVLFVRLLTRTALLAAVLGRAGWGSTSTDRTIRLWDTASGAEMEASPFYIQAVCPFFLPPDRPGQVRHDNCDNLKERRRAAERPIPAVPDLN